MNLGEINKGAIVLILVLVLGAGGYLWFSQMYQPAVADRTAAVTSATTAETGLATAKQELTAAQKAVEDSKKEIAKLDDSVARLAKARTAIPSKDVIDDAAIALVTLGDQSGVDTAFKAGVEGVADPTASGGALQGAVPVDLEFEAAGTYAEMMQFMSLVESTVELKDDKLYTRGRLFNIVKLEIGTKEDDNSSSSGGGFASEGTETSTEPSGLKVGPDDITFTIVVRMYTSSLDNSQGVGDLAPDPAASATADPNAAAGGATTGTEGTEGGATTTTDGSGATTDPGATGDGAATTDGASTGASTSTGGGI